jgi:serine phosphatase RsbU (regulator of sigma subunit)
LNRANLNTVSSPNDLKLKIKDLDDLEKLHAINNSIWEKRHAGSGQYFDQAQEALKIALDCHGDIEMADLALSYLNLGNTAWNRSEHELAYESLQKAQKLFRSIGDFGKAGFAQAILANLHGQKGDFEKAFSLIFHVIDEIKNLEEYEVLGLSQLSAGSFYFDLESYQDAFDFYIKSLTSFEKIGDQIGIARATNNAGMSLYKLGRHSEGLEYCERSLEIYELINQDQGKAKAKRDIGKILGSQGKPEEALTYFFQSLEIREKNLKSKTSGLDGIITCLMDIGNVLAQMNRLIEAKAHLIRALELSESINSIPKLVKIHRRLSETNKKEGKFDLALYHLEAHLELKKDMLGQETSNKIKMMQTRYALDLAEKEADLEKAKHEELNQAYQKINLINKNITSSLTYAKRIQTAFLPSKQRFKLTYPDSYILNIPKDIVSGDFYWITQKNGFHLLAIGDCSGHGVPGAFMSMVGISLLNQIVNERGVLQPGKILNQINLALINNLNQMNDEGSAEGIDICLCVFDPNFTQVVFAGAKRPLYYIEKGSDTIQELKGTPVSIGFDPFTDFSEKTQRLDLEGIDQLILSTDGFSDQFSESNGKKLMITKFKDLLKENATQSPEQQEENLKNYFFAWKGREAQTDDVLVVGIKLK